MASNHSSTTSRPRAAMPVLRVLALFSMLLGLVLGSVGAAFSQNGDSHVEIVEIDGTITPVMAQYVERGIERAEDNGAAAVVLEIDTPGGLSTAMDDIVSSVVSSEVPVVAYVTPRNAEAASAGVFITYAAHIAVMTPGTNIGSASPVAMGDGQMDETMEAKVTNNAVSKIRNLANLHDRNADWAEDAVRDAANITADEALELNVVNYLAPNLDTLLADIHGDEVTLANEETVALNTSGASTSTTGMNLVEQFLQIISDPTIAYMLISLGTLGIIIEISNPGTLVPGTLGVTALLFGLYALGTLPVNWAGVGFMALGIALFVVDLFVSSFGILMIGGLASFLFGSYMLIDTSVAGYEGVYQPVIWASGAIIALTALFVGTAVLRSMRRRPASGRSSLIGSIGTVRQPLNPSGLVFVQGELWTAEAESGGTNEPIPEGTRVQVTAVEGLRLTVRVAPRGAIADHDDTNRPAGSSRRIIRTTS